MPWRGLRVGWSPYQGMFFKLIVQHVVEYDGDKSSRITLSQHQTQTARSRRPDFEYITILFSRHNRKTYKECVSFDSWDSYLVKFVVMFDESLNRSTNNKQMDLHIRYWAGDCVQSRYFGSRFLGHATAQDLLHNFMVSYGISYPVSFYDLIMYLSELIWTIIVTRKGMFAKKQCFTNHGLELHVKISQSLFKRTVRSRESLVYFFCYNHSNNKSTGIKVYS